MCRSIKWFWRCGCYKTTVLERCPHEFDRNHTISRHDERVSSIECDDCYYRDHDHDGDLDREDDEEMRFREKYLERNRIWRVWR